MRVTLDASGDVLTDSGDESVASTVFVTVTVALGAGAASALHPPHHQPLTMPQR